MSHRFHRQYVDREVGREFASTLPPKKAGLFFETVERVHRDNRKTYRQIRAAREKAMQILGAPEFDETAYRREVKKLHKQHGLMKEQLAEATVELAKQFSQEERKALAKHLKHSRRLRAKRQPGMARTPYGQDP
jgi:uncharacterized membrane protein